ncbi:MAG: LapA family protein, partial [Planctomycetota bacterium]
VQFLSWEAQQVPVIIIILISLLAGVIISSVLGLIKQSKLKDKIRRLQREIEELKYPPVVSPDEDEELEQ